jgi:hypothetical protein
MLVRVESGNVPHRKNERRDARSVELTATFDPGFAVAATSSARNTKYGLARIASTAPRTPLSNPPDFASSS